MGSGMRTKTAAIAGGWGFSCVLSFGIAWLVASSLRGSGGHEEVVATSGGMSLVRASRGKGISELQVRRSISDVLVICRVKADNATLDGATLFGPTNKPVLWSTHYDDGGVKKVVVVVNQRPWHSWGFNRDGTIRFASRFSALSQTSTEEVRQYFNESGGPSRTETIWHHATD